jgi:hypothetical protein
VIPCSVSTPSILRYRLEAKRRSTCGMARVGLNGRADAPGQAAASALARMARGRCAPCRTIEDQFAHRLAGCGRVEHAPDTVAGCHLGTVNTRHGTDQRKAVFGDRPEARLPCFEVGDRGADRATTADHDALARAHTVTVSGSASRFQGRAHVG